MPDTRFRAIEGPFLHPTEPKVAFYWRGTATQTGRIDPPGLAPTGKAVDFNGADFHEYRDGKLARLTIVFDMADLMRQLGVLPGPGSREERVMAKMTNLRGKLPGG
jgi:predicted ester cyclase